MNQQNTIFRILCSVLLLIGIQAVNAQSVDQLKNNYTGNIQWDGSILTFASSGTIKWSQNSWSIPSNVKKVIIGKDVKVTGRFDCTTNVTIEGKDKNTSVLFGTNQTEYAKQNGGGDKLSGVRATKGDVTLKNFTLLNSKGFGFTHRGNGFLTVIDCKIIDNRGGHHNNSDGIVAWGGGLVKGCYIKTGDDNIKVYGNITVENTTLHMIDNSVPIQLGWGDYGSGAKGVFKNLTVTGTGGRIADGRTVISARKGKYNKTLVFQGVTIDNPNASLVNFREGTGNFNITMTDVDITLKKFYDTWNSGANATIKICGQAYGKGTTKNTFKCGTIAPDPDPEPEVPSETISDIVDLKAVAIDCKSVKLTWSDVAQEDAYRIRRKKSGETTFTTLGDVASNVKTYTDKTVAEGVTYIYQVRPMQNGKAVKVSNNPSVKIPACALPKDCAGVEGGTASIDKCGECSGGNTGITPNSTCLDCNGVVNGTAKIDECGVCAGGSTGIVAGESCKAEALPVPGKIEAEAFVAQQGVQTQATTDAGGGKNVGWIAAGDWMDYEVEVEKAGMYKVSFRVASAQNAIKLNLKKGSSVLVSVNTATTNGWQNWKTITTNIDLVAGTQTLRVVAASGGWNFNWMQFAISLPKDCAGVEGGTAKVDDCDICSGGTTGIEPNSSCRDCAGIVNGAALSNCDVCWGGTTGVAKPDADKDGILDCNDECPNDATNKCNEVGDITDIDDLKAVAVDCKSVKLTWADVAKEEAYRIRRKKSGETTFTTLGDVKADVVSYLDNTVAEGITYIYQVRPMQGGKAVKVSNNPQVKIPSCDGPVTDCQNVTIKAVDFNNIAVTGFSPAYIDVTRNALAINAAKYPGKTAAAKTSFTGKDGVYNITITSMLETDGECNYKLKVAGALVGSFKNIPTTTDYKLYTHAFENVTVKNGNAIQVEFNAASNGTVPEGDGFAYARGRWTKIAFVCVEGDNPLPKDCAGIEGGSAFIDDCGDCVGGTTGKKACVIDPGMCDTYGDKNGFIIMEAENTTSPLGKWVKKKDVSGYTGSGHLEFTGNGESGGSANSPLKYTFTVKEGGDYRLVMRARKRLDGAESDKCNDGYVNVQGDYVAGNTSATTAMLKKNMKFFGGSANGWGWAVKLDEGHVKHEAVYKFKAGETYTLTMSGRSIRWNVDRIIFYKDSKSLTEGQNTKLAETFACGDAPLPKDCAGVEGGSAKIDDCNICSGGTTGIEPNSSCRDCAGIVNGAALSNCGVCWGGTTGVAKPDADNDGILDCNDECPNDATNACNDNGDCTPWSGNGIWKGNGRIAISSDGNEHDKDDWAATPFSLALLAAKGLQDQLVLYTFSDHVWGSNDEHSDAKKQMLESALEGKKRFGFDNSLFIEAVSNKEKAYNAMAAEINKSSAANPLFIIGAGPMHVIGEGLRRANKDKRQYVTLISHSNWNNNHQHNGSYTWAKIKNEFANNAGGNLKMIQITDQNGGTGYDGMRASASKFAWLKTSEARNNSLYQAGSWQWLYDRQVAAEKNTEFDPSDAGMIIYLLTGIQKTDPSDAKKIMENPVAPCSNMKTSLGTTAIDIAELVDMIVYPNPVAETAQVKCEKEITSLVVTSQNGTTVLKINDISTVATEVSLADLLPGYYYITATTENGTITKRILKK